MTIKQYREENRIYIWLCDVSFWEFILIINLLSVLFICKCKLLKFFKIHINIFFVWNEFLQHIWYETCHHEMSHKSLSGHFKYLYYYMLNEKEMLFNSASCKKIG